MNNTLIARNSAHLQELIRQEMRLYGFDCSLNHIDISGIKDLSFLFDNKGNDDILSSFKGDISGWDVSHVQNMQGMFLFSNFNGDISDWNVANVRDMSGMFSRSQFNGDISKWDTSHVVNMISMFRDSEFNGDISKWNVSHVSTMIEMFKSSKFNQDISVWEVSNLMYMDNMFMNSQFNQDLTKWTPHSLQTLNAAFHMCPAPKPYWAEIENRDLRIQAIQNYQLNKRLQQNLVRKDGAKERSKI